MMNRSQQNSLVKLAQKTVQKNRLLLLFTTTGYQAAAFKEAADKLGIAAVAGSDRCHVLEDPWRDGAIPLRFEEPAASAKMVVEYAAKHLLDAVIPIGDKPTLTAAMACQALGLLHNSPAAVRACRDKYQFRQLLQAAGVDGPAFCRLPAHSDSPPIPPPGVGFPCVLKPVSLSASRGVIRADNTEQFTGAFNRIQALLKTPDIRRTKDEAIEWILAENYLEGPEVALEGILDRGALQVLALFDKPDPLEGPYFEETIYTTPSRLPEAVQNQIVKCAEQAIAAVGLSHGPIHAELRLTPQGPRVLEVAARSIGGLCSRSLRFDAGMSLEELIIRHALNRPIGSVRREDAASGVMMIPVPAAGVLLEVRGQEKALETPGIEEIRITAKIQQTLVPWPEGSSYLGFIFARAASSSSATASSPASAPAEVEAALRTAHSKLQFVISPALPVVR